MPHVIAKTAPGNSCIDASLAKRFFSFDNLDLLIYLIVFYLSFKKLGHHERNIIPIVPIPTYYIMLYIIYLQLTIIISMQVNASEVMCNMNKYDCSETSAQARSYFNSILLYSTSSRVKNKLTSTANKVICCDASLILYDP